MERIAAYVAMFYGVEYSRMFLRGKKKDAVQARQMAIYIICCTMPYVSLINVGKFFFRDHTTVIFSRNKVKGEIQVHKSVKEEHRQIMEKINLIDSKEKPEIEYYCRPKIFEFEKCK